MFALWPKLTNTKTFLANVDDSHLFGMPMLLDQSYLRFLPMLINLWVTKRLTKILASHGWGNHVIFLYLYHFLEPNKHPRIYYRKHLILSLLPVSCVSHRTARPHRRTPTRQAAMALHLLTPPSLHHPSAPSPLPRRCSTPTSASLAHLSTSTPASTSPPPPPASASALRPPPPPLGARASLLGREDSRFHHSKDRPADPRRWRRACPSTALRSCG
jgi:hypothetical protein